MILVVPTYHYLSEPILRLLIDMKPEKTELVQLDFHQPRADFGRLPNIPGVARRIELFPGAGASELLAGPRLRRRLLALLDELDPSAIVTFSDVTLFARFVKGTRFEERLLVIQPSVMEMAAPSAARCLRYAVGRLANAATRCPTFRTTHYWGELLPRAAYLVWGATESIHIVGRTYRCGNLFHDLPPLDHDRATASRDVLVVVPDLPYYTSKQLVELESAYSLVLAQYPDRRFAFKYHPTNTERLSLTGHHNYAELTEFHLGGAIGYDIVIAGFSTLAITLRMFNPRIILFDLGWYASGTNPYLSARHFSVPPLTPAGLESAFEELVSHPGRAAGSPGERFGDMFAVSDDCLEILSQHLRAEAVRQRKQAVAVKA